MKKSLFVSVLFLGLFFSFNSFTNAANIPVTIYGDDHYVPYCFKNGEKNDGIYTRILEKIFSNMKSQGYDVTIKLVPWRRALDSTKSNEVFGFYPPYNSKAYFEENPWIQNHSEPILSETIVVYTRENMVEKPRPNWPADWFGLKIGIFAGTEAIAGTEFIKAYKAKKLEKVEAKGSDENLLKVATNRVDAYVNDRNAIQYALREMMKKGKWPKDAPKLVEGAVVAENFGILATGPTDDKKFPYRKDFLDKFNAELAKLKASGEIEKIINQMINE